MPAEYRAGQSNVRWIVTPMSTRAYILIETAAGAGRDVAIKLSSISGVSQVALITGPYDIVAMVETEDLVAMGDLVAGRIHAVQGVVRTQTCFII